MCNNSVPETVNQLKIIEKKFSPFIFIQNYSFSELIQALYLSLVRVTG